MTKLLFQQISRTSPLPLFYQVREAIRESITSGKLKPGDRLDSETYIAEFFGVSLITLRRALMELQIEGLITKVQGVGTFVREPPVEQGLDHLSTFSEEMQAHHFSHSAKVVSAKTIAAGDEVGSQLAIPSDQEVVVIERIRYANKEPVMYNIAFFPTSLGKRLMEEDLENNPVLHILENKYGILLAEAEYRLESVMPPTKVRRTLAMDKNTPILLVKRTNYSTDKRPVYYVQLYHRGDKFRYVVNVKRTPARKNNVTRTTLIREEW